MLQFCHKIVKIAKKCFLVIYTSQDIIITKKLQFCYRNVTLSFKKGYHVEFHSSCFLSAVTFSCNLFNNICVSKVLQTNLTWISLVVGFLCHGKPLWDGQVWFIQITMWLPLNWSILCCWHLLFTSLEYQVVVSSRV